MPPGGAERAKAQVMPHIDPHIEPHIEPDIEELFDQLREHKRPPLEQWHPRETLDIGLRIAADGQWYHQGGKIQRRRLVGLFSSVLRLDPDGNHYLVTPRLKYPVAVEDAPFRAVEVKRRGAGRAQNLFFRTNAGDAVLADREHPIRITTHPATGQPSPYVEVRAGLQAKISRPVYYELAQLLEPSDDPKDAKDAGKLLGLYSAGQFFPFGRIT